MMTELVTNFRGELAALAAALIWAIASTIYTQMGRILSPLLLNLAKGLVAIALLLLTLGLQGHLWPSVSWSATIGLALSGVIGIGLGDTAYFMALNQMGARRTLILEALAPPLSALLALIFLQEQLPWAAWSGIGLTIVGVTWVMLEAVPVDVGQPKTDHRRGIVLGLLAALGQAGGAVLSRSALVNTDIDPLWSTLVRLVAGNLVILGLLVWQRRSPKELSLLRQPSVLLILVGTAFASTYLGIWLQQISLKYAAAGIAQALSATSPLFVLPLAIVLGERVTLRAIGGVLIALVGVWLLFNR